MASLYQLTIADKKRQAHAVCVRWHESPPTLGPGTAPAILPVTIENGREHFVALLEARNGLLCIWDFPRRPQWVKHAEVRSRLHWNGTALHVCKEAITADQLRAYANSRPEQWWLASSIVLLLAARLLVVPARTPASCAKRQGGSRAGLSMVELLVSIGVAGLIVALFLPAVQRMREQARQAECRNNLRQLMVAVQSFESSEGRFPQSRREWPVRPGQPQATLMSPHVELLPFLDHKPVQDRIDLTDDAQPNSDPAGSIQNAFALSTAIRVFQCPSDAVGSGNSYRACTGTSPSLWETTTGTAEIDSLIGWTRGRATRTQDVSDGLSNTAFFSEKLVGDRDSQRFTAWRDLTLLGQGAFLTPGDAQAACSRILSVRPRHASYGGSTWLFGGYSHTWYNHVLTPNDIVPDCTSSGTVTGVDPGAHTARSLHAGGVHVAYGDGAVRFVSQNIDVRVWRAQGSIKGHESANE